MRNHVAMRAEHHVQRLGRVVLTGLDWNTTFLYYARRQGLAVPSGDEELQDVLDRLLGDAPSRPAPAGTPRPSFQSTHEVHRLTRRGAGAGEQGERTVPSTEAAPLAAVPSAARSRPRLPPRTLAKTT